MKTSNPIQIANTTSASALTAPIKVKRKVGVLLALKIVLGRNLIAFGRACREKFVPGVVFFFPIFLFASLAATATWFWFPFNPGEDRGGLTVSFGGMGAFFGVVFTAWLWEPFVKQVSRISQEEFEEE